MINTCQHCTKRHAGCHADCPEYNAARLAYEAAKEKERKKKAVYNAGSDYIVDKKYRTLEQRKRRK